MSETQRQLDASSSLQPSRPGILRSKSNSDMSTTSSESKASTITFAPLPFVEIQKRRNSRPIGVAGRAEMLRRSMNNAHQQYGYEDEQMSPNDDDDIIPLPDVGKLIKGLWRAVSRMQKNSSGHEVSHPPNAANVEEGEREEEREGKASVDEATWPSSSDPSSSTTFPRDDHPH